MTDVPHSVRRIREVRNLVPLVWYRKETSFGKFPKGRVRLFFGARKDTGLFGRLTWVRNGLERRVRWGVTETRSVKTGTTRNSSVLTPTEVRKRERRKTETLREGGCGCTENSKVSS